MEVARDVHAIVEGMRRFTIHGEQYVVVYYSAVDAPDDIQHARLSADALPSGLGVGDAITVHVMMGVVVGVSRRDE